MLKRIYSQWKKVCKQVGIKRGDIEFSPVLHYHQLFNSTAAVL